MALIVKEKNLKYTAQWYTNDPQPMEYLVSSERFCLGSKPGAGTAKLVWVQLRMEFKGSKQPSSQVENRVKADEVRMQELETTPRHHGPKAH